MPRDEFRPQVKRKLAQRSGYQCSICNGITVGPSAESESSVNLTGVAAHITAASVGGRRYDPNLTAHERGAIDNGIWLCSSHADLIDGDEKFFTTEYLKSIKKKHEERIRFKQSGINVEKGIVTRMELRNIGLVTDPICLEFTERNIIYGNNGVGKTQICEFIAALTDKRYLDRWAGGEKNVNAVSDIFYYRNQLDKFTILIHSDNRISYYFNDNQAPFLNIPIKVFYLQESFFEFLRGKKEWKTISRVDLLSEYFNLSKTEFINVVISMAKDRKIFVNDFLLDDKGELIVKCGSGQNDLILPFDSLSGGEKERVILDITLRIANYYAKFSPTILIVENTSFGNIDKMGIDCLFDFIREEELNFQFFFTTVSKTSKFNTKGFRIIELVETSRGNVLAQQT